MRARALQPVPTTLKGVTPPTDAESMLRFVSLVEGRAELTAAIKSSMVAGKIQPLLDHRAKMRNAESVDAGPTNQDLAQLAELFALLGIKD